MLTLTGSMIFGILEICEVNSRSLSNLFYVSDINWFLDLHYDLNSSSKMIGRTNRSSDSSNVNVLDKVGACQYHARHHPYPIVVWFLY